MHIMGEEKTIENHKVYYDQLPLDLTREILLRLPAKSLVRFRCVSKLWSSLTTEPDFIKSFTTFSSSRPRLLLTFGQQDTMLFFSLPQPEIPDDRCLSQSVVSSYHINLPRIRGAMSNFESVHGLISFNDDSNHIVVCNPSISQHVTIHVPDKWRGRLRYLGYDPCGDTYKLLFIPQINGYNSSRKEDSAFWVLTLGDEESWRIIEGVTPIHCGSTVSWKCIGGVVYYEVYTEPSNNNGSEPMEENIMSFNVRFETFKPIKHPCNCVDNFHMSGKHYLLNYHGRLALVCSLDTKLWILENETEEKWVCNIDLHLPTHRTDPTGEIIYQLSDATVTGEFIYVGVDGEEVHVLYYDPKKNGTRRITFEESMYKEFEGFGEGGLNLNLDVDSWSFARCFPTHIESLFSLKNITCSEFV